MKTKVFKNNEKVFYTNKKTEIKDLLKKGEEVFYIGKYIERKVNQGKLKGRVRWGMQRFHEKCDPFKLTLEKLDNIF